VTEILSKEFSRTAFLKGGGAMVVGFGLGASALTAQKAAGAITPAGYNPPLNRLDSWLRVNADNTIALLTSEGEVGQGISTGFLMVAAEELDVDLSQMIYANSVPSATGPMNSVNDSYVIALTGGIGGSNSMSRSGPRIRAAAVAARAELLKLASAQLGVPVSSLSVSKGVVTGGGKSVTYGELVGGKLFNVTLTTTSLDPGAGASKPTSQYKLVGTMAPRVDIPHKVTGKHVYTHGIRIPGMLHARWVRPGQGPWLTQGFAKPLEVDTSSIKHLKSVRVLREGDFLAVVSPVEYDAIQAAAQLKVTWAEAPILPGHGNLFKSFREADSAGKMPARIVNNNGNFDAGWNAAAKRVSGVTFKYPYNGHTPMGPAVAVADYRALGGAAADMVTVFHNTQNVANTVTGIQQTLKLQRPNQVRVVFYEGASSFGNGYHYNDISESAALISKLAGAPIRLQLMRWDEQGWNKYGPAIMLDMRGGVDANGNMVAFEAVAFAQAGAGNAAVRQILGDVPAPPGASGVNEENLMPMYRVAQTGRRLIAKTQTQAMGMFQNGPLRAPSGPQTSFAAEQFVDMLAIAAGKDPHSFRVQNMRTDGFGESEEWPRYTGVLNAAVQASGYKPHVSGSQLQSGDVVSGWGMAVGTHNDSYAAVVAHVTVNKKTGKVTVNNLWAAQDSGRAINPDLLQNQMTGSVIQGTSKLFHEQLMFDRKRVISRDWVTYPILRFADTPKVTTVVVNRPDRIPSGSGEPPLVPCGAAIANAMHDATGVRFTHAPLTPARVRGFLKGDTSH
jgi:CO/xanthine dehydrogenase Mo-binding subunit